MMIERNKLYKVRWIIIEYYFGKFNDKQVIAGAGNINDACYICDAFLNLNKGRPFTYKIVKIADDYIELLDNPIQENYLTEEKRDLTKYLTGVDAI